MKIRPRLKNYPLAIAYDWTFPKHDTGGIFYIYPPVVSRTRRHPNGVDWDFYHMKRERINALDPTDIAVTMRDAINEPRYEGSHSRTAMRRSQLEEDEM